jgi:hypothetical protein
VERGEQLQRRFKRREAILPLRVRMRSIATIGAIVLDVIISEWHVL